MGGWCIFGLMLWSYILWMFLAMLLTILARAYWNSETVHIALALKGFDHPYFHLGLSFYKEVYLDKEVETFILGLFFFSIDVTFVRNLSKEEEEIINRIKKKIEEMHDNNASAPSDDSSVQP